MSPHPSRKAVLLGGACDGMLILVPHNNGKPPKELKVPNPHAMKALWSERDLTNEVINSPVPLLTYVLRHPEFSLKTNLSFYFRLGED